jgi:hypothetical protein
MVDKVGIAEMAFALGRAALAQGQEAREPAIGGAVLGKGEKARAVGEIEPAADDEPQAEASCRLVRPHDSGKAVAVGDGDRR